MSELVSGREAPASPTAPKDESLARYADLIIGFGANVRPGQLVEVRAALEARALARAVAASGYRAGARFVDVIWHDPHVRRARILHADPETLEFVPAWHRERVRALGEHRCARIALGPSTLPAHVAGLDAEVAAREPFPFLPDYLRLIDDNTTNWTGVASPTPEWAQQVHPDLDPDAALARLWEQVLHIARVDEDDPADAWRTRFDELVRAERALNELRFDSLRFEGPGTDLVVGLLPSSTWDSGSSTTVGGIEFAANIPTEEVFTAPDPARTEGVVTATKPLVLKSGVLVEGLVVEFRGGRAVRIDADRGADALRAMCARDEGGARLGEVALVDRRGRIGPLGTVFFDTLLDENAASHVALGAAYPETVGEDDRARANRSKIHIDFMIGGDAVDVTGIRGEGTEVPVLRRGEWQV